MSRMLFVSAVLVLLMQAPAVLSRPPDGPSGRLVQDAVPALQDEVKRLEKEVASDKSLAEDLAVARAHLAAAEGNVGEARRQWRKVIAAYEERLARWEHLATRGETRQSDGVIIRGVVAEKRCSLAEVEGDRTALVRELPKVISAHEARLQLLDQSRRSGANEAQLAEEERAISKELRQARQRLDAVNRR
jgi:predicted component of type VI protein secretion system